MIDHVLLEFIGAIKSVFEGAMLERSAVEERLQMDLTLGDVTFETTYSLPGEETPPRIRADISLEWSTWSQSAYRSWTLGDGLDSEIEIDAEIVLHVHTDRAVELDEMVARLEPRAPEVLRGIFALNGVATEEGIDLTEDLRQFGSEFIYQATLHLDEPLLEHSTQISRELEPLGTWLASQLVRLDDINRHDGGSNPDTSRHAAGS
jgi:hypothetical protein